jgi:uncharacterized membrane protein
MRVVLASSGLVIAAYLTLQHYSSKVRLVCTAGAVVNCESVLTSRASMVLGVPVAAWGLAWFSVAVVLAIVSLRIRSEREPRALRNTGLAWTLAGTGTVLWLVYQEIGVVGKICLWCTAIHALVLGLLTLQVMSDPVR